MARPNKQAEVAAAFHAVLAMGLYPTYDRVLEQMGGGSKATIRKYLPALRDEHGDELDKVAPRDEPMPESVHSAFRRVYNQVLNLSEDRLISEEVNRLESEKSELLEKVTMMDTTIQQNSKPMAHMFTALHELQGRFDDLEANRKELQRENDELLAIRAKRGGNTPRESKMRG